MPANISTFQKPKCLAMIEKMRAHLREQGGASVTDMAALVGLSHQRVNDYMRHMEKLNLVVCAERASPLLRGGTAAYWMLAGSAEDVDAELVEPDTFPRKVIVREEWEPNHARSPLDCAFFGVPAVLEAA